MRAIMSTILLLVLAGGAIGVAFSFYQWHRPMAQAAQAVVIAPGTGTLAILRQLHGEGLIPPPWTIALPLVVSGDMRRLKAGEYAVTPGMSAGDLLDAMAAGNVVVHAVTIPEGFTVAQIKARLLAEPLLSGELPAHIPEGSLFPDTWSFQREEARSALIGRMQARMRDELARAWEMRQADLPIATPEEALILASIVEEETGIADERPLVAGVYLNRLRIPMRLQSDPTVAYGIAPAGMQRMLTLKDLARDSPYNTYTRDGLPPGPICNPGRDSLEAVMRPAETEALYFVATGDGGHRFARTHAEHEQNVRAYRAVQRAKRREGQ